MPPGFVSLSPEMAEGGRTSHSPERQEGHRVLMRELPVLPSWEQQLQSRESDQVPECHNLPVHIGLFSPLTSQSA